MMIDVDENWREDVRLVVAHTRNENYLVYCEDSNPNHLIWRQRMAAKAEKYRGLPEPAPIDKDKIALNHIVRNSYKPPDHQYPSLLVQAGNAVQAAAKTAVAAVRGEPVFVSEEVLNDRLDICYSCDYWDANWKRCALCGCSTYAKTRLATEACPAGKWPAVSPETPGA